MKSRTVQRRMDKSRSPHWCALTAHSIRCVPRPVRRWIVICSSMTKYIEELVKQRVVVKVLREERGRIHFDEQRLLDSVQSTGHVREITLNAGGRTLLVARTVFIARRLRSNRKLRGLGSRPLGELLFSKGVAKWRQREFGRVTPRHPVSALIESAATRQSENSWARRTVFIFNACPILVTEVFLPDLLSA